jgi:hypothetical protein
MKSVEGETMATHTEEEIRTLRERADRAEAELAALHGDDSTPAAKEVASALSAGPIATDGEEELRKDSMMAHLMDSLLARKDIGHYGRLVFAIVARNFLSEGQIVTWLTRDEDFCETKARAMLGQVEEHGYNPPRRERILQWQKEQEFPILPNPEDPDCGNLYRSLKFPDAVYKHIEEYQEQRHEVGS